MKRGLAASALALVVISSCWAVPVSADAPLGQGWWTSVGKPNPDVPADGLLIEGGVTSPTSLAALVYDVPERATVGRLKLTVAPGSGTTLNVTLQLCRLSSPSIRAEQGGPMANAPAFDCGSNVTASSSDGTTFEFDVTSLLAAGALAVAILPTAPASRVVLARPDAASLPVAVAPVTDAPPPAATAPVEEGATEPVAAPLALPPAPAPSLDAVESAEPSSPANIARATAGDFAPTFNGGDVKETEAATLALLLAAGVLVVAGWLFIGKRSALRAVGGGPS